MHIKVKSVEAKDRKELLDIAIGTGVFASQEAEFLLGEVLGGISSKTLPADHRALCSRVSSSDALVAWSYVAPDQHTGNVWNLWWIGVSPEHQNSGVGGHLLRHIEHEIAGQHGRIVVIETSDAEPFSPARRFYSTQGYLECGRVSDFYTEGEAKVIFARRPRLLSA